MGQEFSRIQGKMESVLKRLTRPLDGELRQIYLLEFRVLLLEAEKLLPPDERDELVRRYPLPETVASASGSH